MTTLVENPMPVIFLGIVAEAVLATMFVSTRRGAIIWAMLGVLVLVFAGVALEMLVVTEVERVEAVLDGAASAVEHNDLQRLLDQYFSPSAVQARAWTISAMQKVDVTSAKISGLTITINRLTSPPTADAEFRGVARFEPQTDMIPYRYYAANFEVKLRLEGDRWLIIDPVKHREL